MDTSRYEVEKHTDHEIYAFRVYDLQTNEKHGYGLTFQHALELAILHDQWNESE